MFVALWEKREFFKNGFRDESFVLCETNRTNIRKRFLFLYSMTEWFILNDQTFIQSLFNNIRLYGSVACDVYR